MNTYRFAGRDWSVEDIEAGCNDWWFVHRVSGIVLDGVVYEFKPVLDHNHNDMFCEVNGEKVYVRNHSPYWCGVLGIATTLERQGRLNITIPDHLNDLDDVDHEIERIDTDA